MDTAALQAERDRLWVELQANGGRGVDVAERIDELEPDGEPDPETGEQRYVMVGEPQRFLVGAYRTEDETQGDSDESSLPWREVDGTVAHDPSGDAEAARLIIETVEAIFARPTVKA